MSTKKFIIDNFLTVCSRIYREIGITKDKEFIEIIGISQPTFSRKKNENSFEIEWAYIVAVKYNLLTEWILTGKGPKRINSAVEFDFPILNDINRWLKELIVNEPARHDWFSVAIQDAFPLFKEWKKRREDKVSNDSESTNKKIA